MAFNASKYRVEFGKFFAEFIHAPPATHWGGALTNRFVEACRASPYAAGHLMMLLIIAVIIALA